MHFDYDDKENPFLRNRLLSELKEIKGFELKDGHEIAKGEPYYFGDDIYFKYGDKDYYWSSNDCIYSYDSEKKTKRPVLESVSKYDANGILEKLSV